MQGTALRREGAFFFWSFKREGEIWQQRAWYLNPSRKLLEMPWPQASWDAIICASFHFGVLVFGRNFSIPSGHFLRVFFWIFEHKLGFVFFFDSITLYHDKSLTIEPPFGNTFFLLCPSIWRKSTERKKISFQISAPQGVCADKLVNSVSNLLKQAA